MTDTRLILKVIDVQVVEHVSEVVNDKPGYLIAAIRLE